MVQKFTFLNQSLHNPYGFIQSLTSDPFSFNPHSHPNAFCSPPIRKSRNEPVAGFFYSKFLTFENTGYNSLVVPATNLRSTTGLTDFQNESHEMNH